MLTRELLTKTLESVFGQPGEARYLTDEELRQSLQVALLGRTAGQPVRVFAYGSLIWNPVLRFEKSQRGILKNWKRAFCMKITLGRASSEYPGRMLALLPGSETEGVVYQLYEDGLEDELMLLWKREMCTAAYIPRWETVSLENGETVSAIVFVMRQEDSSFDRDYDSENVVSCIAAAKGPLGTNAEYLHLLNRALEANNLSDPYVSQLAERVGDISRK